MKRLVAIMAGALLTTVGGVYAQFTYAQGNVDEQVISAQKNLAEAVGGETKKGTINVTGNFLVSIDDTDKNLITETTITDTLKVTFTPAAQGADADVRDHGIKLKMTIAIGGTNKYNNIALFALNTAAYTEGGVLLNGGNKVKDAEVSLNLANYIEWKQEFTLSTMAEYEAFQTAFEGTTITVTVSEAK